MNVEAGTNAPATESVDGHGLHYPDLKIEGFRGIKDLHIQRLGRVNLITGKNNTGKSTVLEALLLHANNGAPRVIGDILASRGEYLRETRSRDLPVESDSAGPVATLFHGFPSAAEDFSRIVIGTSGHGRYLKLEIHLDWYGMAENDEGMRRLIPLEEAPEADSDPVLALVIEFEMRQRIIRASRLRRLMEESLPSAAEGRVSCVSVSPYSANSTRALGPLWDAVALTEDEDRVVEALQIIESGIVAATMVEEEGYRGSRKVMARIKGLQRPMPLRSLGDGVNRLFSIALSMVNAKGGILLIDEFENGLHYSAQADVWRMIFELASRLDVQVFATTHSWDAVKGFQQAASESPQEGMLLRLVRWRGKLYVTSADEDDLEIITRDNIEVR